MFPSLTVPDCHTIAKAFEKGANYCATEESVFAMMTPMLTGMRANAKAFVKMADATEAILPDTDTIDDPTNSDNPAAANAVIGDIPPTSNAVNVNSLKVPPTVNRPKWAKPTDVGDLASKITKQKNISNMLKKKGKECIPCTFRIDLAADLVIKMLEDISEIGIKYKNYFMQLLQQLLDLITFWKGDKYHIDVCALRNFFLEYVCIPDFRRIITALMALLIRMAMELNGLFDLILMLVAPLLLPFLLALISPLEQMLLLIIKPLECIIDSIIMQMEKLDYSAVFNLQVPTISIGPLGKKKDQSILKTSSFDNPFAKKAIGAAQDWGVEGNISPSQLFSPIITDQKKATAEAQAELEAIRKAGGDVDKTDTKAREAYAKQLEAARAKYMDARKKVDTSVFQRGAAQMAKVKGYIRDAMAMVMKYIEMAKTYVTEFINMIFDEIKKLMDSFLGTNGNCMIKLWDKLQIVQLIAMIVAIIDFLKDKKPCKEDKDKTASGISIVSPLMQKTAKIWTDNQGVVHIDEDPDQLSKALDQAIGAMGQKPGKNLLPSEPTQTTSAGLSPDSPYATEGPRVPPVPPKAKVVNGVNSADGQPILGSNSASSPLDATRQRMESLVELTGDPVIDSAISRAIEAITSPMSVQYKCPLQTSVADAEQVNQWIQELNSK